MFGMDKIEDFLYHLKNFRRCIYVMKINIIEVWVMKSFCWHVMKGWKLYLIPRYDVEFTTVSHTNVYLTAGSIVLCTRYTLDTFMKIQSRDKLRFHRKWRILKSDPKLGKDSIKNVFYRTNWKKRSVCIKCRVWTANSTGPWGKKSARGGTYLEARTVIDHSSVSVTKNTLTPFIYIEYGIDLVLW